MPKFEKCGCLMASRLLGLLFIRHSVWRLQDVAESTSYEIVAYYYLREKAVKSSMCSLLYFRGSRITTVHLQLLVQLFVDISYLAFHHSFVTQNHPNASLVNYSSRSTKGFHIEVGDKKVVFTKLIQLSRFNQIVVKVRESLKLFKVPISCNLWILRECLFSVHDNRLFSGHDLIDLRLLSEP